MIAETSPLHVLNTRLADETASRQAIAEHASYRIKDITLALAGSMELGAQAQASAGAGREMPAAAVARAREFLAATVETSPGLAAGGSAELRGGMPQASRRRGRRASGERRRR